MEAAKPAASVTAPPPKATSAASRPKPALSIALSSFSTAGQLLAFSPDGKRQTTTLYFFNALKILRPKSLKAVGSQTSTIRPPGLRPRAHAPVDAPAPAKILLICRA